MQAPGCSEGAQGGPSGNHHLTAHCVLARGGLRGQEAFTRAALEHLASSCPRSSSPAPATLCLLPLALHVSPWPDGPSTGSRPAPPWCEGQAQLPPSLSGPRAGDSRGGLAHQWLVWLCQPRRSRLVPTWPVSPGPSAEPQQGRMREGPDGAGI